MSIYSTIEVYPSCFDEGFDCKFVDCSTCNFDCWIEAEHDVPFEIYSIFKEKGYREVNWDFTINPCLTMYNDQSLKFQANMKKLGYGVNITRNPQKRYQAFVFIHVKNNVIDPKKLLDVFLELEVVK